MLIDDVWGEFFKAEIKTSGSKLFAQDKITISSGSDTGIHAFVKVSPPFKVQLAAADIASASFTATCSCPGAKKGRLCKHIWATLLMTEVKYPDFLSAKRVIEMAQAGPTASANPQSSFKEAANLRASLYRKVQYQKQKLKVKEKKKSGSRRESVVQVATYPPEMEAALAFFSENGFPLLPLPSETALGEAKRRLSRVFHPDRGGTHAEIVELNRNSELVLRYLRTASSD